MPRLVVPPNLDVLVIGGGPAGASVARLLAAWGHSVTVLTRPAPAPALAESLPPSLDKLFDRIGVRAAVEAAGFLASTGNTVRWGHADERAEDFPGGRTGYQIDRAQFDRVLLNAAREAGATVHADAVVLEVQRGAATKVVYDDGARHEMHARWILDCTGRTGLLARSGLRRAEPGGRTLAIAGIWDDRTTPWDIPDQTHTLVESYEGGWGWSVPVSPSRRFVTVMVDPALTSVAAGQRLQETYRAELNRTSSLRRLAQGATLVAEPFARDASPYSALRAGEDGLLLVGDAASFVDPLSSYGVKKALASAWLAAVVVHSVLGNAALLEPALALYESRERAMYDSLRARLALLAREAGAAHPDGFWSDRADQGIDAPPGELEWAALRTDPAVLGALDEMKKRPSIALRESRDLRRLNRAIIRENVIVMEPHLAVPAFASGVRFIRDVDLATIVTLAPSHDQVPDLFEAYNRRSPPVALADFLGALAVLVGKGFLDLA